MGVDWLSCDYCGETFPDCCSFVSCNDDCYKTWCSDECAEKDGHIESGCKVGCDVDGGYFEYDVTSCIKIIDKDEYDGEAVCCEDCPNYIAEGCKFCREEDYEDTDLLEKALELLGIDRKILVDRMKEGV